MTTQANIYIDQGTDFATGIDVVDDGGEIVNLNLTTIEGQARRLYSSEVIFSFVITITSPTEGKALIELDSEVTALLAPGKYRYDIIINLVSGKRMKLLEGLVFIVETVTEL
jgi:hypothetical protein